MYLRRLALSLKGRMTFREALSVYYLCSIAGMCAMPLYMRLLLPVRMHGP